MDTKNKFKIEELKQMNEEFEKAFNSSFPFRDFSQFFCKYEWNKVRSYFEVLSVFSEKEVTCHEIQKKIAFVINKEVQKLDTQFFFKLKDEHFFPSVYLLETTIKGERMYLFEIDLYKKTYTSIFPTKERFEERIPFYDELINQHKVFLEKNKKTLSYLKQRRIPFVLFPKKDVDALPSEFYEKMAKLHYDDHKEVKWMNINNYFRVLHFLLFQRKKYEKKTMEYFTEYCNSQIALFESSIKKEEKKKEQIKEKIIYFKKVEKDIRKMEEYFSELFKSNSFLKKEKRATYYI